MVSARRALGIVLLALAAGGCTTLRPGSAVTPPSRALPAGMPTADQLAMPHRARAAGLERSGQLRLAVEAWTTALALAPAHEPSRRAVRRLRARIDREMATHLHQGWHALASDDVGGARRHFRAALALDPDSRGAREALRAVATPPPAPRQGRPPVPAVQPPGLGVAEPGPRQPERPRVESSDGEVAGAAPGKPLPPVEPEARPPDGSGAASPAALHAAARDDLAAGRDEAAYRTLVRLARVSPGYRDAATLLRELRPRLVRQRYQEGLRLFREERLEDAITQWRAVLELDPGHAHAGRHIEQAEKMLRTLAAHRKR